MSGGAIGTAAARSLVSCHICSRLTPLAEAAHGAACSLCGAPLHRRKPMSVQRAWALVITAAILYVPANLFPVMTIMISGKGDPHTIIGGAVALFQAGSYSSGFLVLVASVVVPLFKIAGLAYMLLAIRSRSTRRLRDRTVMYRFIEVVGRWSMIDMFMVSILTALVNLGVLALVEPGIGALCFAAVVILTMVAAISFDPRLMWDVLEES